MKSIHSDSSHSLHDTVVSQQNSHGDRLLSLNCRTERFRRLFFPAAIRLCHGCCWCTLYYYRWQLETYVILLILYGIQSAWLCNAHFMLRTSRFSQSGMNKVPIGQSINLSKQMKSLSMAWYVMSVLLHAYRLIYAVSSSLTALDVYSTPQKSRKLYWIWFSI